jgi:hypothetical protein
MTSETTTTRPPTAGSLAAAARDLSARLSRLADVLDRSEPDSEHAHRIERALGECSHGATVAAVNVAGVRS